VFHPPCHVGDEWFVPVGLPVIFVPFFLVHDRLRRLERSIILEVEGETPEWFMKLIRHEAAHAYAYAFQLFRKRSWQRVFGKPSADDTPSFYRPRPTAAVTSFILTTGTRRATRRGFRGNVRSLAHPGIGLADALSRLEGVAETRVCGGTDGPAGRQLPPPPAGIPRGRP